MKKNIFNLLILVLVFSSTAKAQLSVQAVINADGSKGMNITDANGKITTITAADDAALQAKYLDFIKQQSAAGTVSAPEQKPQIVNHRAVLGMNGKQQIIVTFASGKEIAIDAVEGQTIQQSYLAYLKKEGLSCGCSPAAPADNSITTHTATRNANGTVVNQ